MLRRLRHRSLVRRDAEHRHVDAEGGADHRTEEALVAGNVHDARDADAGKVQVRIPGFERDAAALLLGQAVGVDSGQRLDERRLAMIDVPCRSDDDAQRG